MFPYQITRLDQIRYIQDLIDLCCNDSVKIIDSKTILGYIECLEKSLVKNRKTQVQEECWDKALMQYSVNVKKLHDSITRLKDKMLYEYHGYETNEEKKI